MDTDLDQARHEFLLQLEQQGYARCTKRVYEVLATRLCEELAGEHGEMTAAAVERAVERVLRGNGPSCGQYRLYCLNRFVRFLRETGRLMIPVAPMPEPSPRAVLMEAFTTYLREQRGLSVATIAACLDEMRRFLDFRFGKDKLGDCHAISGDDLTAFLTRPAERPGPIKRLRAPSHLRAFLIFLFWSGRTKHNLAPCIPPVKQGYPNRLPRYLEAESVLRLLDSVRRNGKMAVRNTAMVLLMARLGLRSTEVIAIRLEDVDWRAGELTVRGKGKRHDRMPLPVDVGEAIVAYVRGQRRGSSRHLFVGDRAPYPPFKDAQILNTVLREAFRETGLKPPQSYSGAHVLRHSLATELLRKGASLDEVSQTLRHRSRGTTGLYAKYGLEVLRELAPEWPEP